MVREQQRDGAVVSTAEARSGNEEIPPDNATRVAIFDAMHEARKDGRSALTVEELHERVLPRLRVLVPRELHVAGESAYLEDKIKVCLDARLLVTTGEHGELLALTDYAPRVRFPNDEIRDYTPGLEPARERLEADNARLRDAHFDVRDHVTSTAADPERFAVLVQSMREHGYLKHFPIVELSDGDVLDGRARRAAAAAAGIEVERFKWPSTRDKEIARRRDTPLTRVLLVLDQNAPRLKSEDRAAVHDVIAKTTGRTWEAISADLELTQAWRGATSRGYKPTFACRILRYRPDGEPKIHVTKADNKVAIGTLLRAAGLAGHKRDWVRQFVPMEAGRSDLPGAGPSAFFAPADVLLEGIETMVKERRKDKMKVDAEWAEITDWLRSTFSPNGQR